MSRINKSDVEQLKGILEQFSLDTISEAINPLNLPKQPSDLNLVNVKIPITESIGYEIFSTLANLSETSELTGNQDQETEKNVVTWREVENQGDQAIKKVNVTGVRRDKKSKSLKVVQKDNNNPNNTKDLASGQTSNKGEFNINFAADAGTTVCLRDGKEDIDSHKVSLRIN